MEEYKDGNSPATNLSEDDNGKGEVGKQSASHRCCYCPAVSGNAWTCFGAPLWLRRCLTILVSAFLVLVIILAIAASVSTKQYSADVPPLGYDQDAFAGTSNHSVVIVGAGAAGIFAGYALHYAGLENVRILEARSEFGGRTQQFDDFDVPLDLGAEWIHVQPNVLGRMLLPLDDDDNSDSNPPLPTTIRYQPQTIGVRTGDSVALRNWFS
ncbi:MAG: hypothetical protein SGARI_006441, partial [Bacillariaceae sp.]